MARALVTVHDGKHNDDSAERAFVVCLESTNGVVALAWTADDVAADQERMDTKRRHDDSEHPIRRFE